MKEFLISLTIIIIISIIGINLQKYLENTGNELSDQLNNLKQEILAKDAIEDDSFNEKIQRIMEQWKKKEQIWATMIVHEELDNINVSLISVKSEIENKKIEEALKEIDKSIFWIRHIKEKEELKLENIF